MNPYFYRDDDGFWWIEYDEPEGVVTVGPFSSYLAANEAYQETRP
jgi:predicted RNase H-like HicB family nuclease